MSPTTIAFLGLGNMGGPMAANLAAAGHSVHGFDLVPELKAAAKGKGARVFDSGAAAVAEADVVITSLPSGAIVRDMDGAGDLPATDVALVGTTAQINTALNALRYTPEADYFYNGSNPENLSVIAVPGDGSATDEITVELRVLERFAGEVGDSVTVTQGRGVTWQTGTDYLLAADENALLGCGLTGPSSPELTISRALRISGLLRVHTASIRKRPRSRARPMSSSASAAVTVRGFSTRTALPPSRHSLAEPKWSLCVEAT